MTDVSCTTCRQTVAGSDRKCEHCGTVMPSRTKRMTLIVAIFVGVIVMVAFGSIAKYIWAGSTDPARGSIPVVNGQQPTDR